MLPDAVLQHVLRGRFVLRFKTHWVAQRFPLPLGSCPLRVPEVFHGTIEVNLPPNKGNVQLYKILADPPKRMHVSVRTYSPHYLGEMCPFLIGAMVCGDDYVEQRFVYPHTGSRLIRWSIT